MKTLLVLVAGSIGLIAADPWKGKKAADWDAKDATRVLTNSPWAKIASAEMDFARMGGMRRPGMGGPGMGGPGAGGPEGGYGGPGGGIAGPGLGGPGGGVPGGGGPGGGGPGRGGYEGPRGPERDMEPPKILVRWESAAPIREANVKLEDKNAAKLAELSKDYYVLSTSGMRMMRPPNREGEPPEGRPQPDFSRMQQRMIENTALRVKDNTIAPAKVEMLDTANGRMMLFLFPRSEPIDAAAKDVQFETAMGPMSIKTKFNLKDMVYEGKPAL